MTITARTLMAAKAKTEDGDFPVRELFFSSRDWTLRHVLVDLGGWLSREEVLVTIRRFERPDDAGWPLAMSRAELDDAPMLDPASEPAPDLPPVVIGPFGNTFSPLLAATVGMEESMPEASGDESPSDVMRDGSGRVFRLERMSEWIGREAFGPEGPLGEITDFRLTDDFRMTDALLKGDGIVSLSRFRRLADQGHAVFG